MVRRKRRPGTEVLTVRLPLGSKEKLEAIAVELDTTLSELCKRILLVHLRRTIENELEKGAKGNP